MAITGKIDQMSWDEIVGLIKEYPCPKSPKGYESFLDFFLKSAFYSLQDQSKDASHFHLVLANLLRDKPPTYYLTPDISEALSNTNVPQVEWEELPFDSINLFTKDGTCIAIVLERVEEMDNPSLFIQNLDRVVKSRGMDVNASDAKLVATCVFFEHRDQRSRQIYLTLVAPFGSFEDIIYLSPDSIGFADDISVEDYSLNIGAISRLIINSILLIKHQPSLVSVEKSCTSGRGFSQKPFNEPMPVRWLGKGFSNARTRSSSSGSHISPRAHWRRGHWHGYRYGQGRQTLKRKWVQPVYVNPSLLPREDGAMPAADHQPIELY